MDPKTDEWQSDPLPDPGSAPIEQAEPPPPRARKTTPVPVRSNSSGSMPALRDPDTNESIDLERVAEGLLGGDDGSGSPSSWESSEAPAAPPDEHRLAFEAKRARSFVWLWIALVLVSGGIAGGTLYRRHQREAMLDSMVEKADARVREATYEGDAAARDAYASAVRIQPKVRKYFAMVALGAARLAADQGEDSDATAWAMLRRSEKEAARHKPDADPRADRELRQARGLLALARGEACPPLNDDEDGDIAARCATQKGDVDGARRILAKTIEKGGDSANLRALLQLGSIELGAGDLDAADGAFRRVLAVAPQHPRALVGRGLVSLERGESPTLQPPPGVRLGPTTEAWFHLAEGLRALGKNKPDEDAKAQSELDLARKGIVHDGRLALLYGRARLQQGLMGEAEQAMRIAERLDPNDGDVAVLDAEVALAKGFEDKVALALSVGAPTPRRLAVLGRAQCLTGKYKEAAATLDAALARRPGDATAITYRAISRAHLGDQAGALRELEKAATQLASTTPRYGLGLLAYERHDLLRAKTELGRALEHNSESFRARALLGRVLRDLGKPKEALAELQKAARDAPALQSVHQALGRLYLDLGRDREARAELRPVLDAGKASVDDKLAYTEATIDLGLVTDGEAALKDATDAGALAPKVARLRTVLSSWKPAEALNAAKALEKERKGANLHDARLAILAANAWRRAGDLKHAGDDLRAALYGDGLHANLGLGRIELSGPDPSQAEASFRAALAAWDRGPYGVDDQTEARVGLARALYHRRAYPDAIAALTPALTDDPQAPEPRYWLAKLHADQGHLDQARPHADRAVELDDHYADAWLLVGDLNKTTAKDKARTAYKKYLELQPDGAQAKTVKKTLASLR
jgi:tetratricopeptide (TPR) repeat protein